MALFLLQEETFHPEVEQRWWFIYSGGNRRRSTYSTVPVRDGQSHICYTSVVTTPLFRMEHTVPHNINYLCCYWFFSSFIHLVVINTVRVPRLSPSSISSSSSPNKKTITISNGESLIRFDSIHKYGQYYLIFFLRHYNFFRVFCCVFFFTI